MARPGYLSLRLTDERYSRISILVHELKFDLPDRPTSLSYRITEDRKDMIDQIALILGLEGDYTTSVIDFALNLAIYRLANFRAYVANFGTDLRADELVIDYALAWTLAEG